MEIEHKRAFLVQFQRWERIFARKDGDETAEKWLIAEYYKSLSGLGPEGWEALTEVLKARCTFFPSIKECLEVTKPGRYDYGSPFYRSAYLTGKDATGSLEWRRDARDEIKRLAGINGNNGEPV